MDKSIVYGGQRISVSEEVAEFLEDDRRRQAAQDKRDERHLSKSDFETVLFCSDCVRRPVEDAVLWNLQLEILLDPHGLEDAVIRNLRLQNLRKVITSLSDDEQKLIRLYFYEDNTMEQIGLEFGISKMAISKRLKKLYAKMRGLL